MYIINFEPQKTIKDLAQDNFMLLWNDVIIFECQHAYVLMRGFEIYRNASPICMR